MFKEGGMKAEEIASYFWCSGNGCKRFFLSPQGASSHKTFAHGGSSPPDKCPEDRAVLVESAFNDNFRFCPQCHRIWR